MAKAPNPRRVAAERKRDAIRKQRLVLHVDDAEYVLRATDVTPALAGEYRRQTGLTVLATVGALYADPDLDVVASAVWLARRLAGDSVTWDEVAEGMSWDQAIWMSHEDDADDVEDGDPHDPPPSGGD